MSDVTLTSPALASPWTFTSAIPDPTTGEVNVMNMGEYIAAGTALYFDEALRTLAKDLQADTVQFQSMISFLKQYEAAPFPTTLPGVVNLTAELESLNLGSGLDQYYNGQVAYGVLGGPMDRLSAGTADFTGGPDSIYSLTGDEVTALITADPAALPENVVMLCSDGRTLVILDGSIRDVTQMQRVVVPTAENSAELKKLVEDAAVKLTQISQGKAAFQQELTVSKGLWESFVTQLMQRASRDKEGVIDNFK